MNPFSGLEKRQCSLHLALSPINDNVKLAIVFHGIGQSIFEDEINAHHEIIKDNQGLVNWAKKRLLCNFIEITL